jgi:4-amino-4-deoxy-L-arabinose transferase-like glycosyltransferase
MKKIKKFFTLENVFLVLIVALAAYLRFYNLENTFMFQGDQGRDALTVANIFKEKDPVFIGPVTSIGNMYLGPFYYYFMLPFLYLSYPNPIGPVYAVAALSTITVVLIYFVAKKIFNQKMAFLATIFFTFSHVAIDLARFSWNPNPAPFFSILMLYFTYLAINKKEKNWLLVSLMFSILLQLHYVTLLSFIGAAIVFFIDLKKKIKEKQSKKLLKFALLSILIFLLSLTPLVLFDYKHEWRNAQALINIVSKEQSFDLERKSGREGFDAFIKLFTVDFRRQSKKVLFDSTFGDLGINNLFLYLSFTFLIVYLIKNRKKIKKSDTILFSYLLSGLFGLSLYQHEVYTHYFAYLLPIVYLFYAWVLTKIKPKFLFYLTSTAFVLFFLSKNANFYSFKDSSWSIKDVEKVANSIQKRVADGEKYNLVLLSESKDLYGMNYRYFLSTMDNPPLKIEEHHQAKKLFIINEEKKEQDLLNLDIYEILVFPEKNIIEQYQFEPGPEITVLGEAENNYNNE